MDHSTTLPTTLSTTDPISQSFTQSFDEAKALKTEAVWRNLATITLRQAISEWLTTLTKLTAKNYASGMRKLIELQLLNADISLQAFALLNHDALIDRIKTLPELTECSKQARAACYIAFTRFLSRRTGGIIAKAVPSREGSAKTFYKVREKVATEAMSRAQWTSFLQELCTLNQRDCLIAKIMLQGGKRMNEALNLTTDMIDYAAGEITFKQSKTKGYEKETVITYPQTVIDDIKVYINGRDGRVFITKTGQPVMPNQLAITFQKAGKLANIPFKITPHVLRASTVTYLKREGFSDSDIIKVTGHASAAMVNAYDKSERAMNASKKIALI